VSRRKILLLCGSLAIAAISLGFYVPHYFSPIAELVAEMRSLLEPTSEEAAGADLELDQKKVIEIEVLVALIDLSKTGSLLLADEENGVRPVCGVVKDSDRFFAILRQLGREDCIHILSQPSMATRSRSLGTVSAGQQVPIVENGIATGLKFYGSQVELLPTLRSDGRIHLDVVVEYSEPHEGAAIGVKGSIVVRDGQTCFFFSGVKRNFKRTSVLAVPLLHDVPGIGPWFVFRRDVEAEHEMLVIVTPKLVISR
jgi:Flp pilus assembly secretin CpaC